MTFTVIFLRQKSTESFDFCFCPNFQPSILQRPKGQIYFIWLLGSSYLNKDLFVITFILFLGNKIDEFKSNEESFEIYHVDCATVPSFRDYHAKLQPWLLFFIDAASYIDIDDSNWRFFLV